MDKPNRAAAIGGPIGVPHEKSGGIVGNLLAFPLNLISGYLVGLLAPVAGLAAIVGGIYLLTRQVPFVSHTYSDDEGGQRLSLKLMPPDQARAAFVREKERISADLNAMGAEIKAFAEQAEAQSSMSEED